MIVGKFGLILITTIGAMRTINRIDSPDNRIKPFRGTIDNDGYTRMRDYNGNTLRGYIENDGYGTLRNDEGNTYRVKPR